MAPVDGMYHKFHTPVANKRGTKTPKSTQTRSYPRGVGLDFRKLGSLTLQSFIEHHGVHVRPDAPPSELAVAVARHFESMEVDDEECVGGFLERLNSGMVGPTAYSRQTQYFDGFSQQKRKKTKWAARPGEQVAAKVIHNQEESWILGQVQRYYPDIEAYDVRDEDDPSKLIRLPWRNVMRLSTGAELGCFVKGTECLAIFPETTSFYKARISRMPVWKLNHGEPTVKDIVVKFEDDINPNTGSIPNRRVPSGYVIRPPSKYFHDQEQDYDLTIRESSMAPTSVKEMVMSTAAST